MKRTLILLVVVVGLSLISLTVRGQNVIDDYGTKPPTKDRQISEVEFHVALELMKHNYSTPAQKALLIRSLRDPHAVDADMATVFTFSDAQAKEIFYAIGSVPIDKFRAVYRTPVLADKKLLFLSYDKAGRAEVWRTRLASEMATRPLTNDQIEYLIRLSSFLDDQNIDGLDAVAAEAKTVLGKSLSAEMLENVGPYAVVGSFCKSKNKVTTGPSPLATEGSCVCSVDHYNYSCNDSCGGGGGCSPTDGGCSIFWLRNCDGSCSLGYEIMGDAH